MNIIEVASAIIIDQQGRLLLVRKKNTQFFMQVGGKLESGEHPEQALVREIFEEIGCRVQSLQFIAKVNTQAANEPDHQLISHTYFVELIGIAQLQAELAEMVWLKPEQVNDYLLAPLTKEFIVPWWLKHTLPTGQQAI